MANGVKTVDAPNAVISGADSPLPVWVSAAGDEPESVSGNVVSKKSSSAGEKTARSRLFYLLRRYASFANALRLFGAVAVGLAMVLYLIDGLRLTNDLGRFATMLGMTVGLMTCGFLVSVILGEQRGSRVLIGLGLLSVPVNFTVFGALLYSYFPFDQAHAHYPGFAQWQLGGVYELLVALIAGGVILVPAAWLGFTVLARAERLRLSLFLVLSGVCLIVPVRTEIFSTIFACAAVAIAFAAYRFRAGNSLVFKTLEGKFALALLLLAPLIIAVRSLYLYAHSGVLPLAVSVALHFVFNELHKERVGGSVFRAIVALSLAITALCISMTFMLFVRNFFAGDWMVVMSMLLLLGLANNMAETKPEQYLSQCLAVALTAIATIGITVIALGSQSLPVLLTCVAVLIVLLVRGLMYQQHPIVGFGTIGLATVGLSNANEIWHVASATGWWGIAAIGVITIVLASLLDRNKKLVELQPETETSE